ncbi:MAG: glycosyltransferase family 2 protein [Bacilli bacterium]|jgi:cellulose synthase/poly-beta-1,6-N-acetylglucosamine synthase-like glycosyltransferase
MELIIENTLRIYLLLCLLLLILYIPRIWYYLAAFKKQPHLKTGKLNYLAVLVPAKNESRSIQALFDTLNQQTYDRRHFDVHVIVEDDLDPTIAMAEESVGAIVHIVPDQTRKGEALDGALKKILETTPEKYDAFIIVDADNLVHREFLAEMNNALATGRQIIVGKKRIKNWESANRKSRSLFSNCTALVYTMVDDLGNAHRTLHDIPVSMCGTGMLVRADVIKDLGGWPYRTLTEDYEMMMDCLLHGYTSMYYKYAIVYTEEAVEHHVSFKRRMRWLSGYTQCNRKYRKAIVQKTFGEGEIRWKNFDFLYSLLPVYIFAGASLVTGIVCGLAAAAYAIFFGPLWWPLLRVSLIAFGLVYGVLVLFTILTLIVDRKSIKMTFGEILTVIFFNPLILGEFIWIFIRIFIGTNNLEWDNVERIAYTPKKDK